MVDAGEDVVGFGVEVVCFEAFELEGLDFVLELLDVVVELGLFGLVGSESGFEELLLIEFLLVPICDVVLELEVIRLDI